jgi:EF-P beta-lysylation protein EpmB
MIASYLESMPIVALSGKSVRGSVEATAGAVPSARREPPAGAAGGKTTWRDDLRLAIRNVAQLLAAVGLTSDAHRQVEGISSQPSEAAAANFPVFAPLSYVARMKKGDAADPLLRQVLALADEEDSPAGFELDPVGDGAAELVPGLLKKYGSRALLVTTGACAIHCRYCFRRHYPYSTAPKSADDWQPALDRIAADGNIDEVILSGGDPLTLVDSQLGELARRIAKIAHVRRLRIHTRLPIVIPRRVNDELLAWLRGTRLTPIMVVHTNHAQEIDEPTSEALRRMVDAGIPVLNQAVLLRGVNDNADALIELSRRLVDLRVMPYYLHQLDRVSGAAHFEVPIATGLELIDAMRRALPGYAVPRYVHERAGEASKTVLR